MIVPNIRTFLSREPILTMISVLDEGVRNPAIHLPHSQFVKSGWGRIKEKMRANVLFALQPCFCHVALDVSHTQDFIRNK